MKSNSFLNITVVSVIAARFVGWILLKPIISLLHWLFKFFDWYNHRQRKHQPVLNSNTMYEFRPFELQKCDYKSYTKGYGRGINFLPKARSGHRIVASETDIFCFGGRFAALFTDFQIFQIVLRFLSIVWFQATIQIRKITCFRNY